MIPILNKLCGRPPQYAPAPCKLTFDLESGVTWATSVPILVFRGLSVLDLGLMYVTDVRRTSSFNALTMGAGDIIIMIPGVLWYRIHLY